MAGVAGTNPDARPREAQSCSLHHGSVKGVHRTVSRVGSEGERLDSATHDDDGGAGLVGDILGGGRHGGCVVVAVVCGRVVREREREGGEERESEVSGKAGTACGEPVADPRAAACGGGGGEGADCDGAWPAQLARVSCLSWGQSFRAPAKRGPHRRSRVPRGARAAASDSSCRKVETALSQGKRGGETPRAISWILAGSAEKSTDSLRLAHSRRSFEPAYSAK